MMRIILYVYAARKGEPPHGRPAGNTIFDHSQAGRPAILILIIFLFVDIKRSWPCKLKKEDRVGTTGHRPTSF